MTILANFFRDFDGTIHRIGEPVEVLRSIRELGTHRTLVKVRLSTTGKEAVLPVDYVEERYDVSL